MQISCQLFMAKFSLLKCSTFVILGCQVRAVQCAKKSLLSSALVNHFSHDIVLVVKIGDRLQQNSYLITECNPEV